MITFRFDDISVNTHAGKLTQMVEFLRRRVPRCDVMFAVSPAVHRMNFAPETEHERVFPKELHTESDFRVFYQVKKIGLPAEFLYYGLADTVASHGLVHVDHRLLTRSAQELSIVTSCSLLDTKIFVPPFHKWNEKTADVCSEHGIKLVRYSPTFEHLVYHKFDHLKVEGGYYLHTHDFTYEQFVARFS